MCLGITEIWWRRNTGLNCEGEYKMKIITARKTLESFEEMIKGRLLTDDDLARISAILYKRLIELQKAGDDTE